MSRLYGVMLAAAVGLSVAAPAWAQGGGAPGQERPAPRPEPRRPERPTAEPRREPPRDAPRTEPRREPPRSTGEPELRRRKP